MLLQWRAKQLSQASFSCRICIYKQATQGVAFYVMTEYNAFIHYNIENNIWEEEVPAAKNRVKQLHKACEKLLKWWKAL
jgi:predicted nucleotide-binding protein (sugar kinase/HSP70/actin superfamily)